MRTTRRVIYGIGGLLVLGVRYILSVGPMTYALNRWSLPSSTIATCQRAYDPVGWLMGQNRSFNAWIVKYQCWWGDLATTKRGVR